MAKSKEQKVKEALERARANFPDRLRTYLSSQHGGENYNRIVREYGEESAKVYANEAKKAFREWCDSSQLDWYGNPKSPIVTT